MNFLRRFALFSILFISLFQAKAQDCEALAAQLTWDFQVVPAPLFPGDNFFLEVYVSGFQDLASFQYTISFDPTVLEFQSLDDTGSPLIGPVGNNVMQANTGNLGILWNNLNAEGQTLPDNTAIYKLFFTVVGDPGDCSFLDITSNITEMEIFWTLPDGSTCVVDQDLNISVSNPLCIECNALFVSSSFCAVANDMGTLTFSACGGTPIYDYTVESNTGGIIATGTIGSDGEEVSIDNLGPDTYVVVITDAVGGFDDDFMVIVDVNLLSVIAEVSDPVPCDGGNGNVLGTGIGGAPPYSFEWSTGVFASEELEDVPEGTYEVFVTDQNGCVASSSVVLDTPPLVISVDTTSASCLGTEDGAAIVTASGGTPFNTDEYNFDGTVGTEGSFQFLDPGSYTITVTDEANCTALAEWVIDASFVPTYQLQEVTPIECFGDMGEYHILADVDPSKPIFISDIDGNFVQVASFPGSGIIDFTMGIQPGEYEASFTLLNGCTLEFDFEIPGAPEIVIELVDFVDPDCDDTGGSIDIEISGGVGQLDFVWDNDATDLDQSDLAGGEYMILVTDSNGCSDSLTVELQGGGSLGVDAMVITEVGCGPDANTGAVEVTVTTSATDIEYNWENSQADFLGDTPTIENLGAGTYFVTVTDVAGDCTATAEVSIDGAGNFFFDETITPVLCNDGTEGIIEIAVDGGTPGFQYEWSHDPSLTFNLATNLAPGEYTITVTDAAECEKDTTFTLENPDPMLVDISMIQGVECFGDTDGSATAAASNSPLGVTDFLYTWLDADFMVLGDNFGVTGQFDALPSGEVYVFASDGQCLSDTFLIEIPSAAEIQIDTLNSLIQDPLCAGELNGELDINLQGGTGPFDYDWSTGDSDNILSGLGQGMIGLVVTDDNGCTSEFEFNLINPDTLILALDSILTIGVSCAGDSEAVIGTMVSGGTGSEFMYDWSPNVSEDNIAFDLAAGDYNIVVTDEAGCTAELEYTIEGNTPIEATVAPVEDIECAGGTTEICFEDWGGGTGSGFTYQINFSNTIPIDSCIEVSAGDYSIAVIDGAGCQIEDMISVNVPQPQPITINIPENLQLELGDSTLIITADIISGAPIDSIVWSSEVGGWDCINQDCSSVNVFPTDPSIYNVLVTDINGCTAIEEVFVDVKAIRNVYAPNIFTPDENGVNAFFIPFTGRGVVNINTFRVYDRWGNVMHNVENENIPPGDEILFAWNGKHNGQDVQPGVYVYIAEVEFVDGQIQVFKGSVTLLR